MNPIVLKIGFGLAAGVICWMFSYWKLQREHKLRISEARIYDGRNQNICCICLQEFEGTFSKLVKLSCNHKFHRDCIKNVFLNESIKSCPLCRKLITNSEIKERLGM